MKITYLISTVASAVAISATVGLSGCATSNPPPASPSYTAPYRSNNSSYGSVESIQQVRAANNTSGAGAVIGGVVGGLLGNQVGSGNGKTAATVVGVVGGAVVGNNIEQNRTTQNADTYQIQVRLDNGDRTTLVQDGINDLRVGDRVHVVDSRAYRY